MYLIFPLVHQDIHTVLKHSVTSKLNEEIYRMGFIVIRVGRKRKWEGGHRERQLTGRFGEVEWSKLHRNGMYGVVFECHR